MFLDYFRIIPYNTLLSEAKLDIKLGVVIMLLFFFAGINAILYYIWDVVKSAYNKRYVLHTIVMCFSAPLS